MKKRLVVAILVAISVGLACSATTKTFTNTTGQAATQIVVTFSELARVTSYTSDVFPTQSPASGEAESFTFSGGTLPAGGTFQVTWSPSTARVRGTKWITPGLPTVAATSLSTIPTTYEEIMAQIAHYPDPDEPLYVPAEGETVWLTDLEGHADIYDNDAIKINYAPGFDKSQITKVDVYRNGIKMRFLPSKLDVVINEQMKTFDGNPAERTPKSSHTDHAIFGYEYRVSVFTGSTSASYRTRVVTIKSPIKINFDEVWMQMNISWPRKLEDLTDTDLDAFFSRLKRDGFTGVGLELSTLVDTPTASTAWTLYHADPSIWRYDTIRTPTKAEFARVLSAISRAGLAANVRNKIYISMQYPRGDETLFSAHVAPKDVKAYLESYLAILRDYIPLFEQHHMALLTPFTESDGIISHTDEVKWFYDQLAVGFSGRLGCEPSTHLYLLGWSPFQQGRTFEQLQPSFWDWRDPQGRPLINELDILSVPLCSDWDQRYSSMVIPFLEFVQPALDFYRTHYPETPLMYGELGIGNLDGACTGLWFNVKSPVFDEQEMADIWAASLVGVKLQGVRSVTVWSMGLGDLSKNQQPGGGGAFINLDSCTYRVITSLLGTRAAP